MHEIEDSVLFFLANTREGRMMLRALAVFVHKMAELGSESQEQKAAPQQQQYPIMKV